MLSIAAFVLLAGCGGGNGGGANPGFTESGLDLRPSNVGCQAFDPPGGISVIPAPDPGKKSKRKLLRGTVADATHMPAGCPFHPRCRYHKKYCEETNPPLRELESGHWVACHFDLNLEGIK